MSALAPPTVLRIFPSRNALDHALAAEPQAALATDGWTTFRGLFELIAGGARLVAGDVVGRLLVRAALAEGPASLQGLAIDPLAVRAVHGAIAELRAAGLDMKKIERAGGPVSFSAAARDLLVVAAAYERGLTANRSKDEADKQRDAVLAVASDDLPPSLRHVGEIIVEGDADLFGSRLDLLATFASRGVRVHVRLPWDDARKDVFGWPEASLHALESRDTARLDVSFDNRVGDGPLARLRAAQFRGGVALGSTASVWHIVEPRELARRAAAQVVDWLRAGVPPHRIAVATPDLDGLGVHLAAALEAFEVPAFRRRGPPVSSGRRVAALLGLVRAGERGFPREELIDAWLALGSIVQVPGDSEDEAAGWVRPEQVAAMVRQAGARSTRVRSYREALVEAAQRKAVRMGAAGLAPAHAVGAALEGLIREVSELPELGSVSEHVDALAPLVARAQRAAEAAARSHPGAAWAEREVEAMGSFAELLAELRASARVTLQGPRFSRQEWIETLAALCHERRLAPSGVRAGGVQVMALEDLVGARFERVILAGVDAEAFPRRLRPDLVLTDDLRRELNDRLGIRLLQCAPVHGRPALQNDARDTWLWIEALAACSDELIVAYGVREGDEKNGRSELVDELLRSLGLTRPDTPAPTYAEPRVLSASQALEAFSFVGLADGPKLSEAPVAAAPALRSFVHERLGDEGVWLEDRARLAARGVGDGRDRLDAALVAAKLFGRVNSVSDLNELALCGFRHFAKSLLRLRREEIPSLSPEAIEEGRAAHEALRVVYADLIARGGLAAARRDVPAALAQARAVFDAAHEVILAEVPIHPSLVATALADAWRVVRRQLTADLAREDGREPIAVEHAFDDRKPGSGPLVLARPGGGEVLKIRGSIDRIDRDGAGLVTLDYKRTLPTYVSGRHLQLPLYGAVALRDFDAGAVRVGAEWVSLREDETQNDAELATEPTAFQAQLEQQLWGRLERVLGGTVAPDPAHPGHCNRCDFRALCRFQPALVDEDSEETP